MLGLLSFEVLGELEVSFPSLADDIDAECEREKVLEASVDGDRLLSVKTDEGFEGVLALLGDRWFCFLKAAALLSLATGRGEQAS